MANFLTKSKYLLFLHCPNEFWLTYHSPEIIESKDSIISAFLREQGYVFQQYARKLSIFDLDPSEFLVEFEREFISEKLYTKVDAIVTDLKNGHVSIYEMKSTATVKPDHLYELAFQKIAVEMAGITVNAANLITVDNKYIRQGEINPEALFVVNDVTVDVSGQQAETLEMIRRAFAFLDSPAPKPMLTVLCASKLDCPYIKHHFSNLPDYTVFDIARLSRVRMNELLERGIVDVLQIPEDFPLSVRQRRQVDIAILGEPYIDAKAIRSLFEGLNYPLHFLDYETFNYGIPLFDGIRPYQQIVFQYSLHSFTEAGAEPSHKYFLSKEGGNPVSDLAESLSEAMSEGIGTVVVWSQGFEKSINSQIAAMFPEFTEFFHEINEKTFDLRNIFENHHYTHPGFKGKTSLKSVVPVLLPHLSYDALAIGDGMTATINWFRMLTSTLGEDEKKQIYDDLLIYSHRDTWALVEVFNVLKKISESPLINSISLTNFKGFVTKHTFPLAQSTFFIGANNAGKSAVLKALDCFFNSEQYLREFANRSAPFTGREVSPDVTIEVEFNLSGLEPYALRDRLIRKYGKTLVLQKTFRQFEYPEEIEITYSLEGTETGYNSLPDDVRSLLNGVVVSYFHPHEMSELISKTQSMLRSRLISDSLKNVAIAEILDDLRDKWTEFRTKASSYLSDDLTRNLQDLWAGSQTKIDLPEKIDDLIAVSDITFKDSTDPTYVPLDSQGTGAQSAILYQSHFLLDIDETISKGSHYPIWLLEEPESFLHADLILKLGEFLCSEARLNSIQMLISTHSPLLLTPSKQNAKRIRWTSMRRNGHFDSKLVRDWTEDEIKEMGVIMGDPNFYFYLQTSLVERLIFTEDSKEITLKRFREAGIEITHAPGGVDKLEPYFRVFRAVDIRRGKGTYFLIDHDQGARKFRPFLINDHITAVTGSGLTRYTFENNVHILLLPLNFASEDLFLEFDPFLAECAALICNETFTDIKSAPPLELPYSHAKLSANVIANIDEAKNLIRNVSDVKNLFWRKVEDENFKIDEKLTLEIKSLII